MVVLVWLPVHAFPVTCRFSHTRILRLRRTARHSHLPRGSFSRSPPLVGLRYVYRTCAFLPVVTATAVPYLRFARPRLRIRTPTFTHLPHTSRAVLRLRVYAHTVHLVAVVWLHALLRLDLTPCCGLYAPLVTLVLWLGYCGCYTPRHMPHTHYTTYTTIHILVCTTRCTVLPLPATFTAFTRSHGSTASYHPHIWFGLSGWFTLPLHTVRLRLRTHAQRTGYTLRWLLHRVCVYRLRARFTPRCRTLPCCAVVTTPAGCRFTLPRFAFHTVVTVGSPHGSVTCVTAVTYAAVLVVPTFTRSHATAVYFTAATPGLPVTLLPDFATPRFCVQLVAVGYRSWLHTHAAHRVCPAHYGCIPHVALRVYRSRLPRLLHVTPRCPHHTAVACGYLRLPVHYRFGCCSSSHHPLPLPVAIYGCTHAPRCIAVRVHATRLPCLDYT